MKRLSWKYIAGLIDGEGCIDFQCHVDQRNKVKRLYIVPRLRIAMTDIAKIVLDMCQANFGGNIWEAKRNQYNPNWRPAYYWQVQGKQLRPLLQNVVNHLIIKKEQAKLCIWWIDKCMGKQFNHLDNVEPIRQCAKDEISAMKTDPHRLSGMAIQKLIELMRQSD
jgi:hypothetical protein